MRTLPAPSVPIAQGPMPAATAAAAPPEDPPEVRFTFQGLRVEGEGEEWAFTQLDGCGSVEGRLWGGAATGGK